MVYVTPSVSNYAQHFQQTMISMQDLLGASDSERLRYVGTHLLSGNAAIYIGHQERLRVLHAWQQLEEALPSEPVAAPKIRF